MRWMSSALVGIMLASAPVAAFAQRDTQPSREDTPAARAGLQVGDVVTAINGHSVANADDAIDVLSDMNPGETLAIDIVRNKQPMTLKAQLGTRHRAPAPTESK